MRVRIQNTQRKVEVPVGKLGAAARRALSSLGLEGAELSVLVCGDTRMRRLNREYRGVDAVTDVLSFSMMQPCGVKAVKAACRRVGGAMPALLGDVVICAARAAAQAKKLGHPVSREMVFLLVHGILHLAGYDHEKGATIAEGRAMEAKQRELMRRLTAG